MDFLHQNPKKYQPIIHALKDGAGKILSEGDSVAVYHTASEVWIVSPGERPLWPEGEVEVMLLIGDDQLEEAKHRYGFTHDMTCYQFVYVDETLPMLDNQLEIRPLSLEELPIVVANYPANSPSELEEKIRRRWLFGGYMEDELIGFIGTHDDGSMGLLVILDGHRRRGYGEAMEVWLIHHLVEQGIRPFGHVDVSNDRSYQLQHKLGFQEASERVHWLW